ncbi:ABC transporter ATP-binding protein [Alkalibacillus almallahensis]|uniref:ABC transporter ATP-binding protein n=1 Tax=Alkalibacillus almallahensis TaxID=1379154 RepID=UPI00142344DD|nr:ABC transporter ATP-binding protein [Alkalibacillus almallahensis]NIK11817.1 teichoic acid transport system ATP-binding protein [Alkalibacillus almallahensis]
MKKNNVSNEVVKADKVSVYFESREEDDLKSKAFKIFSKKENKKEKIKWALQDISFEGVEGEILGIIGSNGAGKTTLSKVISKIITEDSGSMEVKGNVTALFSFGMGFNPELTGRENVYLNGMMLGISKSEIESYIEEIHDFSDLESFFDQRMKYYSSGMKARLGFSVASHLQPEILILDEALNTGDRQFSKKAAQKMQELVKQAKMVIIVTHSLKYAEANCDRLVWLEKGKVKKTGDPSTLIKEYQENTTKPKPKKKKILQLDKTAEKEKGEEVIKANNVGVSFNLDKKKFWALSNLDLTVYEGEIVGVIGHNGAGKSTLCKVLTHIYSPDQGEIFINGQTSSLLGYGTGFNPQLTGEDNIFLNAMLLGIPKKVVQEKYDEIIEFSGIGRAVEKPVKEYSSGMKSRLGFSIAAVLKPDIFIIDEALSTGDIEFQQKASERIQELIESAKAVIIVSHNLNFVEKVCTRTLWMEKGQVIMDGPSEEVVKHYSESV